MPNSCNRNHAESFFVKIFFCSTTIQALFKWPTINQQTELHDFSTKAAHNSRQQQQQTEEVQLPPVRQRILQGNRLSRTKREKNLFENFFATRFDDKMDKKVTY